MIRCLRPVQVWPVQGNRLKRVVGSGPEFAQVLGARSAQPFLYIPRIAPRPLSCP
jgi:hypothetical protein